MKKFDATSFSTLDECRIEDEHLRRIGIVALVTWACMIYVQSSYGTNAGLSPVQPVPFSHEHHVGVLGNRLPILPHDGRAVAIRRNARNQDLHELPLADLGRQRHVSPVRESYRTNRSIEWERV